MINSGKIIKQRFNELKDKLDELQLYAYQSDNLVAYLEELHDLQLFLNEAKQHLKNGG